MAPALSTDLSTVNKSSIKFASWVVRVTHGQTYSYSYTSKKSGKEVTSWKFDCRLVGKSETDYMLAVCKGTKSDIHKAMAKYTNASVWEVSIYILH